MSSSNVDTTTPVPSSEQAEGLLPAFTTRQFSHLPTPQSPNNLGRYVHDRSHSPDSPVPHGLISSSTSSRYYSQRSGNRRLVPDDNAMRVQSNFQCATPESSPHFSFNSPPHNLATPRYLVSTSTDFSTPKQTLFNVKLESPIPISIPALSRSHISPSSSPLSEHPIHSSALSSPFMAKVSIGDQTTKKNRFPADSQLTLATDVFSASHSNTQSTAATATISTPPTSPPQNLGLEPTSIASAGGEMERIRQAMMDDRLVHIQEAEKRRPEYLVRTKRTLLEADPSYLEEEADGHERALPVGIMESPHKGRRLKLFQETSEESFEESLMAGGYGRYRTADWVRQPQPISLPSTAVPGSSTIVSFLEGAEEVPPSEKELKKRRRMAAFRSGSNQAAVKLCAVELEGRGRVLIDAPSEGHVSPGSPEPIPTKKRGGSRRKKKGGDILVDKRASGLSGSVHDQGEKPNWPDAEFPWRLRTEERIELAKAQEEERLRWIERFLDRDSDDEDEVDSNVVIPHDETFPSKWTVADERDPGQHFHVRMGRGKMVPLLAYPDDTRKASLAKRNIFPSDPADARAALLSKKSVRTLSYRQQKRQRELDDDEDEEVVCICNGRDDGRELVQCDACQTWYHLQCIGIKNIAELGKEEDPWFCRRCVARSPSPSTVPENLLISEPTFVPTDNEPSVRRSSDTPFFQPNLQESPNWSSSRTPRTPTRGGYNALTDSSRSWSSWADSSRPGPSTPQHSLPFVRTYNVGTPGSLDGHIYCYEESPFDPTSTPSRGIKFHAPFATPKNSGWLPRGNGLFQTPSKPSGRETLAKGPGAPPHQIHLDDNSVNSVSSVQDHYGRILPYDESPIRRNKSSDSSVPRRRLHSPSRPRTSIPAPSLLEESPVMRSLGSQSQRASGVQRTIWNDAQRDDGGVS